jgi:hypothetical protein
MELPGMTSGACKRKYTPVAGPEYRDYLKEMLGRCSMTLKFHQRSNAFNLKFHSYL